MMVADPATLQPVPRDGETMGEIFFRGNITMKGYLKNPKATEEAFAGGWYYTGDLAVCYPDGYAKIKDRSKDIIISGGENISTLEVEGVLYRHPAVLEAAVVARPDEKWGETPCAFVTLKSGAEATAAEIMARCPRRRRARSRNSCCVTKRRRCSARALTKPQASVAGCARDGAAASRYTPEVRRCRSCATHVHPQAAHRAADRDAGHGPALRGRGGRAIPGRADLDRGGTRRCRRRLHRRGAFRDHSRGHLDQRCVGRPVEPAPHHDHREFVARRHRPAVAAIDLCRRRHP